VPGANFAEIKQAENLREGGNLLWGMKEGPALKADPFAKFRKSPLFQDSRKRYEPGWTTHDRIADPRFVHLPSDERVAADLRLQPGSPAVNSGQKLPAEWPDPLRTADKDEPDIGALPLGAAYRGRWTAVAVWQREPMSFRAWSAEGGQCRSRLLGALVFRESVPSFKRPAL